MTPGIMAGVDVVRVVGTALIIIAPFTVVLATWLRAVAGDNGRTVWRAVLTVFGVLALGFVGAVVSWYVQKGYASNLFSFVLVAWYAFMCVAAISHTNIGYFFLTNEKRTRRYGGAKLLALPMSEKG